MKFTKMASKEQHPEFQQPRPQAVVTPICVVRDEAAVFQAAQALFPPSFYAEGINKAKDTLADMEDLVLTGVTTLQTILLK